MFNPFKLMRLQISLTKARGDININTNSNKYISIQTLHNILKFLVAIWYYNDCITIFAIVE